MYSMHRCGIEEIILNVCMLLTSYVQHEHTYVKGFLTLNASALLTTLLTYLLTCLLIYFAEKTPS